MVSWYPQDASKAIGQDLECRIERVESLHDIAGQDQPVLVMSRQRADRIEVGTVVDVDVA
jgi:hypothetical protein